jgi:hypothetical protein
MNEYHIWQQELQLKVLTMIDLSYIIQDMTIRNMKATNPYSGQSAMLSEEEFALYHLIKHAEETEQWKAVEKGLSKFSRMNAAAYMTLLD